VRLGTKTLCVMTPYIRRWKKKKLFVEYNASIIRVKIKTLVMSFEKLLPTDVTVHRVIHQETVRYSPCPNSFINTSGN